VNISAGCVHGCLYCYTQGYRQYPGAGRVVVYDTTAEQVRQELQRKRKRPRTVYFCPSCDAFQPLSEVLDQSYETMKALLENGVEVQFVTKGNISDKFLKLFHGHPGRVSAQIGLTSLDSGILEILEPGAASVAERLTAIQELKEAGVAVAVRADPLIAGVTDGDPELAALLSSCYECGVSVVAASYLFLRPPVRGALKRGIRDAKLLSRVLDPFECGDKIAVRGSSGRGSLALPATIRLEGYERLAALCREFDMSLHLCGCKNHDITDDCCQIGTPGPGNSVSCRPLESLSLWQEEDEAP
jgi:DNA repair photolyase